MNSRDIDILLKKKRKFGFLFQRLGQSNTADTVQIPYVPEQVQFKIALQHKTTINDSVTNYTDNMIF